MAAVARRLQQNWLGREWLNQDWRYRDWLYRGYLYQDLYQDLYRDSAIGILSWLITRITVSRQAPAAASAGVIRQRW